MALLRPVATGSIEGSFDYSQIGGNSFPDEYPTDETGEQIRLLMLGGLSRIEKRERDGRVTTVVETDPLKSMLALVQERWAIGEKYFGAIPVHSPEPRDPETVVNGIFTWVPDPKMPEMAEADSTAAAEPIALPMPKSNSGADQ